jgi:hypothetical protein
VGDQFLTAARGGTPDPRGFWDGGVGRGRGLRPLYTGVDVGKVALSQGGLGQLTWATWACGFAGRSERGWRGRDGRPLVGRATCGERAMAWAAGSQHPRLRGAAGSAAADAGSRSSSWSRGARHAGSRGAASGQAWRRVAKMAAGGGSAKLRLRSFAHNAQPRLRGLRMPLWRARERAHRKKLRDAAEYRETWG